MELRGIEPRTFHMRSEHSTSELQPLNNSIFFQFKKKLNLNVMLMNLLQEGDLVRHYARPLRTLSQMDCVSPTLVLLTSSVPPFARDTAAQELAV